MSCVGSLLTVTLGAILGFLGGAIYGLRVAHGGQGAVFPPILWAAPLGMLCGATALPALLAFLRSVGSNVPAHRVCAACRHELPAHSLFCPQCGTRLERTSSDAMTKS